ncbi:MAG: hypothetical protein ABSG90_13455 [Dehalococcoidia bacterium]
MKLKLIGTLISIAIFYLMGVPLHEWCHYAASTAFGGSGFVTYPGLLGGIYHFICNASNNWFVYLAGGLGVFVVYMLLWVFQWKIAGRWDMDDQAALVLIGATQLGYGIGEMMWGLGQPKWLMAVGAGVGAAVAIAIYLPRVADWLLEKGG